MIDSIIWIFTAKCNLNCKHCYISPRFKNLRELSLKEKLILIRDAAELGIEYIGFSGGEPLIHKDFPILLEETYSYDMDSNFITNGLYHSSKILNLLKRIHTHIYVSLDGVRRETYEYIRGKGLWDRAINFLEILKKNDIDFSLIMSINKINYHEVGEYIRFSEKIGALSACIIPTMKSGNAYINNLYIDSEKCFKAIRLADNVSDEIGFPVSFWCMPFVGLIVRSKYVRYGFCRLWNNIDIDPAGRILLCDIIDIVVSDIRERGLRKAVEEFEKNNMVKKLIDINSVPKECKNCKFVYKCLGGCYARAYIENGRLDMPDPLCPRISGLLYL